MASLLELRQLFTDSDLMNKIEAACIIAAEAIRTENVSTDNHANRLAWARATFVDPNRIRKHMLMALLASNKDQNIDTIQGASDVVIQSQVDNAVDLFADGS